MDRQELLDRLEFRRAALKELRDAYIAVASGRVASYGIGSRNITKLDLQKVKAEINEMEKECDSLDALVNGGGRRKAVAVIPRD